MMHTMTQYMDKVLHITAWDLFGLLGNAFFFSRFFVQWIASERAKKPVIPAAFWWLSIAGSLILLVYSIHSGKLVFILSFLPNVIPYTRNLILLRRYERQTGEAG